MKRVVGVSLGSSRRDKTFKATILGEEFEISRIGTDGDMKRFAELMHELDGNVDAIGLGGMDRYLWIDDRRYTLRDPDRLARIAKVTPVVDGSVMKNTIEPKTLQYLQDSGIVNFSNKKVLLVSAVDRFGMAKKIDELACDVVYGDLMFAIKAGIPMRSYKTVRLLGTMLLPIISKLPFKWLYPTGKKQESSKPRYENYYRWADIIAGDTHLIKRSLPAAESDALEGKIIITNTITPDDAADFAARGVKLLVTPTPEYDGRHIATNVLEGVVVALIGKHPDDLNLEDYEDVLMRMGWQPTIKRLKESVAG